MFRYIKETNFYALKSPTGKKTLAKYWVTSITRHVETWTGWGRGLFPFASNQTDLVEIEGCFLSAGADANYNEGTEIWRRQMEKAGK